MRLVSVAAALLYTISAARAEEPPKAPDEDQPWSLDLTIHDVGIGIGNSKRIDGIRLNFRDVAPFTVHGLNATIWIPEQGGGGDVDGLALGLPLTGARRLRGLGVGLGLEVERDLYGISIGGLGLGAGRGLHGIMLGGLGMGTGGDIDGLALGGLGAGCGGNARGVLIGGLGVGCGGNVTGLAVGGVGIGAGGSVRGILLGGVGAGVGGDLEGIALGGVGVGAGGHIRGLVLAGLGIGAGNSIEGLAVAGLGIGAPRVRGVIGALTAGGQDLRGVALAPAYFHVAKNGSMTGLSVSVVNRNLGEQRGLAIGIVNYAAILQGVQIGVVNYAGNNPTGLKLLPVLNAHFD